MNEIQEMPRCNKCKKHHIPTINRLGVNHKYCTQCLEYNKNYRNTTKCEHGRYRPQCKNCGGTSICEHGLRRSSCKSCGGTSVCDHGRYKYQCKECNNEVHITIKTMIANSKFKDKRYNMLNEEQLITYDYVRKLIDQSMDICCYCNNSIQYLIRDPTLATIERIDNNIGHIIGNCKIACLSCNLHRVGSKNK